MNIFLVLVLAYLIGSVSFALIVGKRIKGIDIRNSGSGNLGATNAFRVLGKKAGTVVMAGDILKGTLAASLPILLSAPVDPVWTGIAAVIGHCYPIYTKFQGGKAVATSGGVILFIEPTLFICTVFCFLLVLILFKMVSLASIVSSMLAVIFAYLIGSQSLFIALSALMIFIIYRHRTNIRRIIQKTEPKVNLFRRKAEQ